uniref:Uncharacterized protein n=2 Tax=Oryza nivara TaxID=4536 RepID=A0A0E0FUF4_ORYNI
MERRRRRYDIASDIGPPNYLRQRREGRGSDESCMARPTPTPTLARPTPRDSIRTPTPTHFRRSRVDNHLSFKLPVAAAPSVYADTAKGRVVCPEQRAARWVAGWQAPLRTECNTKALLTVWGLGIG